MTRLMPLKRVVVEVTHEAPPDDTKAIRKSVKSWHNRLSAGSIPRSVITKLGRELFLDLGRWEEWLAGHGKEERRRPGRPRRD